MDKPALLAAIHAAHARLEAAVAALDDEGLKRPAPGMPGWTRKDVLAHVAWWNDHSVRVAEGLRAGGEPYTRDVPWNPDDWNARVLAENRDRAPADVRRSEAEAFARLVAAVEAASEEELFEEGRYPWLAGGSLADTVIGDSTDHYPDHVHHLR
jgi:hypothetical protein